MTDADRPRRRATDARWGRAKEWMKTNGIVALFFGLLVYGAYLTADRANDYSAKLRDAQVKSCEINRVAIRDGLEADLDRLSRTDPKLFPDIPKATFDRLLAEREAELMGQIASVDPAGCETLFPES